MFYGWISGRKMFCRRSVLRWRIDWRGMINRRRVLVRRIGRRCVIDRWDVLKWRNDGRRMIRRR
jgi:hypothetical protein